MASSVAHLPKTEGWCLRGETEEVGEKGKEDLASPRASTARVNKLGLP